MEDYAELDNMKSELPLTIHLVRLAASSSRGAQPQYWPQLQPTIG